MSKDEVEAIVLSVLLRLAKGQYELEYDFQHGGKVVKKNKKEDPSEKRPPNMTINLADVVIGECARKYLLERLKL